MKKVILSFGNWFSNTQALWKFVHDIDARIIWFFVGSMLASLIQPVAMAIAIQPVTDAISSGNVKKLYSLFPYVVVGGMGWFLWMMFQIPILRYKVLFEAEYRRKLEFAMHRISYWFPMSWNTDPVQSEKIEKYQRYQYRMGDFMNNQIRSLRSIVSTVIGLVATLAFDSSIFLIMTLLALWCTVSDYRTQRQAFDHEHEIEESLLNTRSKNLLWSLEFPVNIHLIFSNLFREIYDLAWQTSQADQDRQIVREILRMKNERITQSIEIGAKFCLLGYVMYQSFMGNAAQVIPAFMMGMVFFDGVRSLMSSIAEQDTVKRKIDIVFEVIRAANQEQEKDRSKREPDVNLGMRIVFHDVCFSYSEMDQVFHGLHLELDFDRLYVLGGENGGGKTTLMMLVTGKLFPNHGTVTINGIPTTEITKEWFSKNFAGYDPDMDIIEGLTIGEFLDPERSVEEGVLLDVLESLGLSEKLHHGLQTFIGSYHPQGTGFSAGQGQRLLIARLLVQLVRNPGYVFADEITSNIAPADQRNMIELIKSYARGGMIISHNDKVASVCDEQLVCQKGTIQQKMGVHA